MKKIYYILITGLMTILAASLLVPKTAMAGHAHSISVSPTSIVKSGYSSPAWPSLSITVHVSFNPPPSGSTTVATVYWRRYTGQPSGEGWADLNKDYGTNGQDTFSFTPPADRPGGTYQFSWWQPGGGMYAGPVSVTFTDPASSSSCSSCIGYNGYGWNGSSCLAGNSSCPAGYSQWYWTSCSSNQCAPPPPACTTYTISGTVSSSSGGVSGAEVCLDPSFSGSCGSSSFRTTTSSTGNYTLNNVTTGGDGHTVYVVPNGFTVTNNSQNVGGSVCQTTTRNFNVTYPTGQGYSVQFERCVSGAWQPISGNRCTTACGVPGAPSPTSSPAPGPTSTPTQAPAQPGDPWIQTEDGDVHSNTGITTP